MAFWRVWNTPRRGLGPAVRAMLEGRIAADGTEPLEALRRLAESHPLARAARSGAHDLLGIIGELRQRLEAPVDVLFTHLLDRTGYLDHLAGEEDAAERKANVEELGNAAANFAATREGALRDFLAETALVSDADVVGENSDRVLMLTAHNAKGLEFPVVIVTGLEEGLFPHASSSEQPAELEEERRLFYVALTRARERVILTAAAYRRRYDGARGGRISRFVEEIPGELVEFEDARFLHRVTRRGAGPGFGGDEEAAASWAPGPGAGMAGPGARRGARFRTGEGGGIMTGAARAYHPAIGREVYHESFGRGVVMGAEARGDDIKFTVRFGTRTRKVMGRFLTEGHDGI